MARAGRVERIHIAPDSGEDPEPVDEVDAVAGRGLRGDRYFEDRGLWHQLEDPEQDASHVTFIEAEALEAIERDYDLTLDPGAHRRNITTRDIPLNHLVDEEFRVGEAVIRGVQLCEPCGYMQALAGEDGVGKALAHRGGLDAEIVESGTIAVGDSISV